MDQNPKTPVVDLEQGIPARDKPPAQFPTNIFINEYLKGRMTPTDLTSVHLPSEIDIEELRIEFSKFCDDYGKLMDPEVGSKAVGFCLKIICIVGPEAKQLKKDGRNKIWKFMFSVMDKRENKMQHKEVHVSVYNIKSLQYTRNILRLTVEEASLLALTTFNQHARSLYETRKIIALTPAALNVFHEDAVDAMSKELGVTVPEVICAINSSCQVDGHLMEDSRSDCAMVAAIVGRRRMKNDQKKRDIVNKVIKQYVSKNKVFDNDKFVIFSKYAHGRVSGDSKNVGQLCTGLKSMTLNSSTDDKTRRL